MKSLLIHLREGKNAIRDEMAKCHKKEKIMWKMMSKNLKLLMRYPVLMYGIRAPAHRREGGEDSGGSDRNKRENESSENSRIF